MNYKFKSKPFAHQSKALEMSWDKEVFAYFMEMGTGKSKVLIDNIAMLFNVGKINGALIIAPKGVYKNWFDSEIPSHMPDYVEKKVGLWRTDPNAKDLKPLFSTGAELHILIMNVEAFSTKKGVLFAHKFLSCHNALISIDESTTIKNPNAKRTKSILSLKPLSKFRRILTGSPVTKSPLDLFSQCQFLDSWLLNQSSYYAFRTRYAVCRKINVSGRQVEIVVGYRNLGELSEKVKPFSYRVLKDDCLDLPPKTYTKRIIELSDEQKKVYKTMKEKAIAFLNGKMVSTATVITQLMRLHQITCGHFTSDDGDVQEIKNNRIDQLMEILEEVEGKAVIWAHYRYDIKKIVEAISKKYGENSVVTYYGDTSTDDRQKAITKIQDKDSSSKIYSRHTTNWWLWYYFNWC
jgi:SNF2 family DNA or RNA helicase